MQLHAVVAININDTSDISYHEAVQHFSDLFCLLTCLSDVQQ